MHTEIMFYQHAEHLLAQLKFSYKINNLTDIGGTDNGVAWLQFHQSLDRLLTSIMKKCLGGGGCQHVLEGEGF